MYDHKDRVVTACPETPEFGRDSASKQDTILGQYRLQIIVSEQIALSPNPALQSADNDAT
ncbi:MAG: hypothetical protein ABSA58_22780 [Acetobacteraceae bacterium]|jgi:hypothetical protein